MKKIIAMIVGLSLLMVGCGGNGTGRTTELDKITGFDVAVEAAYDYAGEFNEGFAKVGNLTGDGVTKYFFIDTDGQVISGEYDYAADFSDGMAMVGNSDGNGGYIYGYINTKGEEQIPLQFDLDGYDSKCHSFYNGYAVVEEFTSKYTQFDAAVTYLIDKNGNKVGDFIQAEEYGMGGGYGFDDPRVLTLEPIFSNYDKFIGTSNIQYARVNNKFPIKFFDPVKKQTVELNEKLEIISQTDGYVENTFGDVKYVNYGYLNEWGKYSLVDKNNNVIIENAEYAYQTRGGHICAGKSDSVNLYTTDGRLISGDNKSLSEWENGYIIESTEGHFTVVNHNMETLWEVQGNGLYQQSGYGYYQDGKYVQHYDPLFQLAVDGGHEYLSAETGEVIIPFEKGTNVSNLNDKYYAVNDGDYSVSDPEECARLINIETGEVYPMEGMYRITWTGSSIMYYTENGSYHSARAELVEVDGIPVLKEITADTTEQPNNEPYVMSQNDISAIYGVEGEQTPVTLKKGEETIGDFAATSLILKNIHKEGLTVDWNLRRTKDIRIVNLEGEALTDTYENMGRFSENYISYQTGGKWGYLKAK